jgi:hypothetical protein
MQYNNQKDSQLYIVGHLNIITWMTLIGMIIFIKLSFILRRTFNVIDSMSYNGKIVMILEIYSRYSHAMMQL